jgi:hypothetical protein
MKASAALSIFRLSCVRRPFAGQLTRQVENGCERGLLSEHRRRFMVKLVTPSCLSATGLYQRFEVSR